MVGICAPYDRGETTVAAMAVANALAVVGCDVHWFPEDPPQQCLDPTWDTRVHQPDTRLTAACRSCRSWVFFSSGMQWRKRITLSTKVRNVAVPDWRGGKAWWHDKVSTLVVPGGVPDAQVPRAWRKKRNIVRCSWGSGRGVLAQAAPSAVNVVMVMLTRRSSAMEDIAQATKAVASWVEAGMQVILCTWQGLDGSTADAWKHLVTDLNLAWLDRPNLLELHDVASRCRSVILPETQSIFGAWPSFFATAGCWPVGYALPVMRDLLGTAVTTGSIWAQPPLPPDEVEQQNFFIGTAEREAAFISLWAGLV